MQLPADYHMHTPLCRHATGEPSEYAAKALERGLDEIGFSDHSPMPKDDFDDWRMLPGELEDYLDRVARARRDFPGLEIRLGLEVDYIPGQEDWIRELAARHSWDYFIGSVHYIGDWAFDNPNLISVWQARDTFEIWDAYFERLTMAAASGLFDIIGHADLCKKFGYYPERDYTPLYDRFLAAASSTGVAVELNTAGLRKDCKEIYPALAFLRRAHEAQVPITFGSDAHQPGEVAADFTRALAHAKSAGYTHCLRLKGRKREAVAL